MIGTSLTWVAHLVTPEELTQARRFATALGLAVLSDEPSKLMLQTDSGDVVEYCTSDHGLPDYFFATGATVVGFQVEDLDDAAAKLANAGFTPAAPVGQGGGVRFQHVRGPGDTIYGLIQPAN